jgi:MFS family permease
MTHGCSHSADGHGRRRFLLFGGAVVLAGTVLFGLSTEVWQAILVRVFEGTQNFMHFCTYIQLYV